MERPGVIAPLPGALAAALHAAPLLPDLPSAVAELVANSLDAGARTVRVLLAAAGDPLSFTVEDDGAGVAPADFPALATAGCTSKQARGEASQLAGDAATLGFKARAPRRAGAAGMRPAPAWRDRMACMQTACDAHADSGADVPRAQGPHPCMIAADRRRLPATPCEQLHACHAGACTARPPPHAAHPHPLPHLWHVHMAQGQALAALAQVADLAITSRSAGRFETWCKCVRRGEVLSCGPCAAPRVRRGTTVAVAHFASCHPVRRRAMLAAAASGALAEAVKRRLTALLLPWPEVQLTLVDESSGSWARSGGGCSGGSGDRTGGGGGSGRHMPCSARQRLVLHLQQVRARPDSAGGGIELAATLYGAPPRC